MNTLLKAGGRSTRWMVKEMHPAVHFRTLHVSRIAANTKYLQRSPAHLHRIILSKEQSLNGIRLFSSYPAHTVVNMPALSPTMETGSISKWNLKEGDSFEVGTSICEVETDKATVSFDASDEGYIAKILTVTGDIKVGDPIMVTVEEKDDVAAFSNFVLEASSTPAPTTTPKPEPTTPPPPTPAVPSTPPPVTPVADSTSAGDRLFASPLAKKLIRESGTSLADVAGVLGGAGSGPKGRVVAADVLKAHSMPKAQTSTVSSTATTRSATPVSDSPAKVEVGDIYSDFILSETAQILAAQQTYAKQAVPHYYLSVELNLAQLLKVRGDFNKQMSAGKKSDDKIAGLSVQDFMIKAAALAMKQVPDVNGAWMDTFVRRYDQVDVNLVMGSGAYVAAPVLKDVGSLGLNALSQQITSLEDSLFSEEDQVRDSLLTDNSKMAPGTFSIHNLGMYGVKSAAPIVLTPQACALSLGAIVDTVVPVINPKEGAPGWEVAPMMTVTLSCDHRVVDGAVGAQWLAAYKALVENPVSMLL